MSDIAAPALLAILRREIEAAGGVEAWCNRNRIYSLLVERALDGACEPAAEIVAALGYQSRLHYVRVA